MSDDLAAGYRASGFGGGLGCGRSPSVLAVDLVRAYLADGHRCAPRSRTRWPPPRPWSTRAGRPGCPCCSPG
ncbi:hypothetical protein [Actinomadura mexicana]|uniref:hypothetical protein n=1 Tax=Actinomadura mexicana TaxID=134959 RepID=UPI001C5292D1|nr:hypothetical protein [Actinomadura mexicana]